MRYIFLILVFAQPLSAIDWNIRGQASAWNVTGFEKLQKTHIGMRYIPEGSLAQNISHNSLIDAELSLNAYSSYDFTSQSDDSDFSTHRAWLRYSRCQFEARFGLQQIKFGPAMMLRPLMWFDQLDPRDPLQFTTGVTGGLVRYYFLNNANIWLWGLVSNAERKGLEIMPSVDESLEFGGRMQYPLGPGELGVSYHHRDADPNPLLKGLLTVTFDPIPENRYALDGKWDVGVGAWFEGVLITKDIDYYPINYQKYLTVGADYTFGLGNGLHILGEHMMLNTSRELDDFGKRTEFTAALADYSITLWDTLMGIIYYNWEAKESYQFLTWRRTYDNWSFNAALFWNPQAHSIAGMESETGAFAGGTGFQLMVIFNH